MVIMVIMSRVCIDSRGEGIVGTVLIVFIISIDVRKVYQACRRRIGRKESTILSEEYCESCELLMRKQINCNFFI